MIQKGKSWELNKDLLIDNYEKSLQELMLYHSQGGTAIVDAQPVGCGRSPEDLVALAQQSGVQIVASTGFHKMIFYPEEHWIFAYNQDTLARLFIHELQSGMYRQCDYEPPTYDIPAKAGVVKCALDVVMLTPQYEKLFHAAAYACNETHRPMMVHIEAGSDPVILTDYLEKMHVDLTHVIFCHMDRACPDLSVHREIAQRGIYLEYDTIGRFKYHDDAREVEIFQELTASGFEGQLLFSLDTTRARLKSYTPEGVGLDYILSTFLPLLKEAGFQDAQIEKISCTNCRRILASYDE